MKSRATRSDESRMCSFRLANCEKNHGFLATRYLAFDASLRVRLEVRKNFVSHATRRSYSLRVKSVRSRLPH